MRIIFASLSFVSLFIVIACATAGRMNNVSIGMTKEEVIAKMGAPISVSATNGTEYLNYRFSETDDHAFYGITTPYFVRIIGGRVESFGRTGDFDSTKTPTIRVERDEKISASVTQRNVSESEPNESKLTVKLRELKKMKDDGVISESEYSRIKANLLKEWSTK